MLLLPSTSPLSATARTRADAHAALAGQRRGWKAFAPFIGPAVMASVGYMDPGNVATNMQAGSSYGYTLLWVVVLANVLAMLFQAMSAKLGIVTGRNLPQLCREHFPRPVVIGMWIGSEIAAIATDLAEFLGGALGFSLLLHIGLIPAMAITAVLTVMLLGLEKRGFRPLERAIAALIGMIGLGYLAQMLARSPDWHGVLVHAFAPQIPGHEALLLAVGIIGATIMPHTIYLHSGLTQQRTVPADEGERRQLLRYSNREVVLALGVAGLINMAMLITASDVLRPVAPGLSDIDQAFGILVSTLGGGAAVLFALSLVASGVSSSVVGTMAGQVIMQGFVGFRIPLSLRRAVTMLPAFVVAACCDPMKALVLSQTVLSVVLPLPLVALLVLSARRPVMGAYTAHPRLIVLAGVATALILALNMVLIYDALQ